MASVPKKPKKPHPFAPRPVVQHGATVVKIGKKSGGR